MSKSLGNVVNPDELVEQYGADALRLYELFLGPVEQTTNFNPEGVKAMRK
jgi:leucyl-tRNA synthetase